MTENEKPTIDPLRFWLIILTFIAGLVWLYFVYVFRRHIFSFNSGADGGEYPLLICGLEAGYKFGIFSPPILLFLSWRFKSRGKRKLSKTYAYILIIISLAQLLFLSWYLVMLSTLF